MVDSVQRSADNWSSIPSALFYTAIGFLVMSLPLEWAGLSALAAVARIVFYAVGLAFEVGWVIGLLRRRYDVAMTVKALVITVAYLALYYAWGLSHG